MIIPTAKLRAFEKSISRRRALTRRQAFRVMDALYCQAQTLGKFKRRNILDGIDVVIQIAKAINRV